MNTKTLERWTYKDAAEFYGIRDWASGYFDIDDSGEVVIRAESGKNKYNVNLMSILAGLKERGLKPPVLLRFGNILEHRIALLNESFQSATRSAGYSGGYRAVYPVKVNQQEHVIEEIVNFGKRYHHGLEVGSKAELMAALAYMKDPEAVVVCNGYKDEEFIEMALYGTKMGLRIILVLEMPSEVETILACSERLKIEPNIGIRIKLSSRAGGHWTDSGGDRSMFGLTTSQVITAIDALRDQGKLECLRMLHYHLGSQIPNIRDIRNAVSEACRFYVDLVQEGAPLGILDVGGGLAVDYDGSHTNFASSSNYSIDEYCADIIEGVMNVMDDAGIAHPLIISESGRATVAHHAVLIFNVLDSNRFEVGELPTELPADAHEMLQNLRDVAQSLTAKNLQESFHDAAFYRDEVRSLFRHGSITLRQRALAEQIFRWILTRTADMLEGRRYVPDELQGLKAALADVYYGNFSVFQSLPDSWAIDQLFPVMPLHRLNERPTREATIADITCDCDGKIDRFIDLHDVKQTLRLHELRENEEYYLGIFLVGAYQETLGDLHNLLGDTNVVGVQVTADGELLYEREIVGDSVADVLSYVEYEPKELVNRVKKLAEAAVRNGNLKPQERRIVMDAYESGLRGYTYFETE